MFFPFCNLYSKHCLTEQPLCSVIYTLAVNLPRGKMWRQQYRRVVYCLQLCTCVCVWHEPGDNPEAESVWKALCKLHWSLCGPAFHPPPILMPVFQQGEGMVAVGNTCLFLPLLSFSASSLDCVFAFISCSILQLSSFPWLIRANSEHTHTDIDL